jgi:uncharacterized protein (TIRG00374 family)
MQLSPQRYSLVFEAVLTGFAANYLLPARLGELFRADYIKRISGLPRSAAIGSIGVERTVDGLSVLGLLLLGLLAFGTDAPMSRNIAFSILLVGLLVFGGLAMFLGVARFAYPWLSGKQGRLFRYAAAFVQGVRSLNRRTLVPIGGLTAVIWTMEMATLALVLHAFGVTLQPSQLVILGSSLTLSTLAPTAPGFLGSLQFVGAALMEAYGESRAVGVAAVTSMQLFCYLPVALLGVAVGLVRWHRLLADRAGSAGTMAR